MKQIYALYGLVIFGLGFPALAGDRNSNSLSDTTVISPTMTSVTTNRLPGDYEKLRKKRKVIREPIPYRVKYDSVKILNKPESGSVVDTLEFSTIVYSHESRNGWLRISKSKRGSGEAWIELSKLQ